MDDLKQSTLVRITVTDLLQGAVDLAKKNLKPLLLTGATLALLLIGSDLWSAGESHFWTYVALAVIGQVYLFHRLFELDLTGADAAFARSCVTVVIAAIPLMAGTAMLLAPGAFLMARWSISTPVIVLERRGAFAALGESWRLTAASRRALFGFNLVIMVLMFFTMGRFTTMPFADGISSSQSMVSMIVTDLVTVAFSLSGWVISAATYRLLKPDGSELIEVFA